MKLRMDPPGRRRRLVVLRHGVTEHNSRGIWQGRLDSLLTADGIAQAKAAAPVLAGYRPELLVTSDLRRARDTAERLAALLPDVELRVDHRLREIDVGRWQGLTQEEMLEQFPDAPTMLAGLEDFRRGDDGETYAEVGDRVRPAVDDVLAELPDGATALLVTHGVVARVLAGDLLGMDRPTSWSVLSVLGNCCWAELGQYGDRWRLQGWNLRPRFGDGSDEG